MAPSVLEKDRAKGFVELATRLSKLHACISDNDTLAPAQWPMTNLGLPGRCN